MAASDRRLSDPPSGQPPVPAPGEADPYTVSREPPAFASRVRPSSLDRLGLPRARRSYVLPVALSVAVFLLIVVVRIAWGG